MHGPLVLYQEQVRTGALRRDPAQITLAEALQHRFDRLARHSSGWLGSWRRPKTIAGLYVHGGVGRGKTMLMDLFVNSLEQADVAHQRVHFHRFMDAIQVQLKRMDRTKDPLKRIARSIAKRRVLCFDEFHVEDIGDAMLLGTLLSELFARRVMLVATSNTEPDRLYERGLQRQRFMPAIEAIKKHCQVLAMADGEDYRLSELTRHGVYYHAGQSHHQELETTFAALAAGEQAHTRDLVIRGRPIRPVRRAASVAWFDFEQLCRGPRSSADYIELASQFGALIVSGIPKLDDDDNDAARRLIHLVDECYDRGVKLVVAAAATPARLYQGRRLAKAFARTRSRLTEMQGRAYLTRPHRPC